ncbi:MAG: transketolase family protein [Actinomycetota bacterium]
MRKAFIGKLVEIARNDPRIVLMTGDLGFTVVEPFAEEFPDRFFNVGVAEQNMVGMATGLAEAGFIPYVYSIVTFASLRPYEFIRNGPVAHRLPVRVLGIGGGFDYGTAGITHYGLEDLGVMRIQPGLTVIVPADHRQAAAALAATHNSSGPIYFRIGKEESGTVPGLEGAFRLGHTERIRRGMDLLIVCAGSVTTAAVAAAEELAAHGVHVQVEVVSSFNPGPVEDLGIALSEFAVVMTVEAHYVVGGLGSMVAEVIAEGGFGCRLVRCGVRRTPTGAVGSTSYMDDLYGLSPQALVTCALGALEVRSVSSHPARLDEPAQDALELSLRGHNGALRAIDAQDPSRGQTSPGGIRGHRSAN